MNKKLFTLLMSSALLLSACGGPLSKDKTSYHILEASRDNTEVNAEEFLASFKNNFHKNKKYYGAKITLKSNIIFDNDNYNVGPTDTIEFIASVSEELTTYKNGSLRDVYSCYFGEYGSAMNQNYFVNLNIIYTFASCLYSVAYNNINTITNRFSTINKHQLISEDDYTKTIINFDEDYYISDMKYQSTSTGEQFIYQFSYFGEGDLATNNKDDDNNEIAYTYLARTLSKTVKYKDYKKTFDGTYSVHDTGRGGKITSYQTIFDAHFEQDVTFTNDYNLSIGAMCLYKFVGVEISAKTNPYNSNVENGELLNKLSEQTLSIGPATYPQNGYLGCNIIESFNFPQNLEDTVFTYEINPLTITLISGYSQHSFTFSEEGKLTSYRYIDKTTGQPADCVTTYQIL